MSTTDPNNKDDDNSATKMDAIFLEIERYKRTLHIKGTVTAALEATIGRVLFEERKQHKRQCTANPLGCFHLELTHLDDTKLFLHERPPPGWEDLKIETKWDQCLRKEATNSAFMRTTITRNTFLRIENIPKGINRYQLDAAFRPYSRIVGHRLFRSYSFEYNYYIFQFQDPGAPEVIKKAMETMLESGAKPRQFTKRTTFTVITDPVLEDREFKLYKAKMSLPYKKELAQFRKLKKAFHDHFGQTEDIETMWSNWSSVYHRNDSAPAASIITGPFYLEANDEGGLGENDDKDEDRVYTQL